MDVSTITRMVQQVWTVDELGNEAELVQETISYGCASCGFGVGTWNGVSKHCGESHSQWGAAPWPYVEWGSQDGANVSTRHVVELDPPSG